MAGVLVFNVVRSVHLCVEDPAGEWTSPGADGAKVSSCEFDRLSAELSSLVILETHNGNSKVLLRLCCLAQVKSGKINYM